MTVRELISALEDYDLEADVRIAIQPRWLLEYTISDVVCTDSLSDEDTPPVVYITEGTQIGYAPEGLFGGGR